MASLHFIHVWERPNKKAITIRRHPFRMYTEKLSIYRSSFYKNKTQPDQLHKDLSVSLFHSLCTTPEFSAQPLDALYRCDLGRVWLVLKWLLEFTCIATSRRSCKVSRVSHRSKLHGGRSTCGVEGQHSLTHRFSPDLSSGSFQLALKKK